MAEDIVLTHQPHMVTPGPPGLIPKCQTVEWEQVKAQLAKLGFNPDSKDPWSTIGISRLEGVTPTPAEINNRLRYGRQIANMNTLEGCTPSGEIMCFLKQLHEASQSCILALPDVVRERKKLGKSVFTWRWMEANVDFVAYLCAMFGGDGWKPGLFLSNVHGIDITQFGSSIISIELAAQVHRKLQGPGPVIAQALKDMAHENQKLILWAPSETPKILALMAEVLKLVQAGTHRVDMKLVVPYNPLPTCDTPDLIQELWTCPLLQRKYMPLMKNITFYAQPLKCVFTGAVGPLHHMKSLAVFHVSNSNMLPGQIADPKVVSWKSNLLDADLGTMIFVDVPMMQVYDINMILHDLKLKGLTGWEYARRSNAHTSTLPRQVICGYFDRRLVSEMDITLTVRLLQDKLKGDNIFIGSSLAFRDETAFMVEFGDVCILDEYQDLCQEILIVSGRKALVTTLHPREAWEPRITKSMLDSPLSAISSIRFRTALGMKNNTWLKPALTNTQLEAGKQRALLCKKTLDEQSRQARQVQLKVEGLPQVHHERVCMELMSKVCEVAKIPLVKSGLPIPRPHEWAPCYRSDGSFAQQLTLHLQSDDEISALIRSVHGSGVRVGGVNMSVEVRTLRVTDPSAGIAAQNYMLAGESGGGQCL